MSQAPDNYPTSEVGLVAYLTIRGLRPVDRRVGDDRRATLYYPRDANLESAVVDYAKKCAICGIAFSEVDKAFASARRMLIDGNFSRGHSERRDDNRDRCPEKFNRR